MQELHHRQEEARRAAATHGWAALLVTPGSDLRHLTGYDAMPLERLTCLVVPADGDATLIVPRLERAAAAACGLDVRLVDYPDGDDPYRLPAALLPAEGRAGVVDVMPAAHLLPLQDRLPGLPVVSDSPGRSSVSRKIPVHRAAISSTA